MQDILQFLLEQFALILLVASIGNLIMGVISGTKATTFNPDKLIKGFVELLFQGVGFLCIGLLAYTLQAVEIDGLAIFPFGFKSLTILSIAYKANSMLLNYVTLSKIPMPKIMMDIDEKVKAMFENSDYPISTTHSEEVAFLEAEELKSLTGQTGGTT